MENHRKTATPRTWIGYTMPDLLHEVTYPGVYSLFVVAAAGTSMSCGGCCC